jgi:hypothetical protein
LFFDQIFTGGVVGKTVYRGVPRERGYSNTVKKVNDFPFPSRDVTKPNSAWRGIMKLSLSRENFCLHLY